MKKLQILILAVFITPFALYGDKKSNLFYVQYEYDYIDNDTKMSKELAKYNAQIKKKLDEKEREPSGFILGVGGTIAYGMGVINKLSSYIDTDYGFDILVGYKWFFSRGFGMRLYGDYNMRFLKLLKSHNIALNYDLLFNWVKSKPFKFGMILGFQMGGNISNYDKYCNYACKQSGMLLGANVGFRFVIYDNSAIEILAQPKVIFKPDGYVYSTNQYYQFYERPNSNLSLGEFAIIGNLRFVYTF